MSQTESEAPDVATAVREHGNWYHTLELPGGVLTPGWFDLRSTLEAMPWPDVRGLRCLDVGPYDGQIAFELERRGAAEVVAVDIGDAAEWDWPVRLRERGPETLRRMGAGDPGGGFKIARRALGSRVERLEINVYDLTRERLGGFDVVTCGSLMLHLRSPVMALEAIRGVCDGVLMSAEEIDPGLTLRHRRRAVMSFRAGERCQWWIPNHAAYRALLISAGYEIETLTRPYAISLGPGHPERDRRPLRSWRSRLAKRLTAGGEGVVHAAALCRPVGPGPA